MSMPVRPSWAEARQAGRHNRKTLYGGLACVAFIKPMKYQALSILPLFLAAAVCGQDKPTVFVAPLDGDMAQVQGWQPALGEGLAEMLTTELSRSGKFEVLESTALKDLKDEISLGDSGYVSDQEKVAKGGFAGADFMFRGKVTRFGSQTQGINLGGFSGFSGGSLGIKTTTSDVAIDWRLVDAYTRKVIKSGRAEASHKGSSFDIGTSVNGHGGNIGFGNSEFMNSALGKATAQAVTNLTLALMNIEIPESGRHIYQMQKAAQAQAQVQAAADAVRQTPGTVIAVVNKSTLIVSIGGKQGAKPGDKLNLFEVVNTKDDKGTVVFTEEKPAGEITLQAVQDDRSKASYDGAASVQAGWIVRAK
jgi:curli biogenesis system outer membrane secretion channel CsgG